MLVTGNALGWTSCIISGLCDSAVHVKFLQHNSWMPLTLDRLYKKAYDSVPHTWLLKVLELYKIDITWRSFLEACIGQWVTVFRHLGKRDIPAAFKLIR